MPVPLRLVRGRAVAQGPASASGRSSSSRRSGPSTRRGRCGWSGVEKVAVEADGGCRFTKQNRESKGVPFVTPEILPRFIDDGVVVRCECDVTEWPSSAAVSWPDALPSADVRPKRELHAGATFVPIWRDLKQRANLGEKGCYGGVDYVVERVSIDGEDAFEARPGARR